MVYKWLQLGNQILFGDCRNTYSVFLLRKLIKLAKTASPFVQLAFSQAYIYHKSPKPFDTDFLFKLDFCFFFLPLLNVTAHDEG